MATRLDFSFAPGRGERPRRQRVETDPLRVLVIGDLRGATRPPVDPGEPLAHARVLGVGIDTFDALIAQLAPAAVLDADAGEPTRLSFRALADFHPDHLYDCSRLISELRKSRERLLDPRTFPEEKARLLQQAAAPAPSAAGVPAASDGEGSPLERLLGQRPTTTSATGASDAESAIDQLLRRIVAPHVAHAPNPEQTQLVKSVDTAIQDELRRLLHAPAFQRLEAIWRGLFWLVNANPAGEALQVLVLDASRDELLADLRKCGGDITRSRLHQLVVQGEASGPGKQPISLILGDFTCEGSESDVSLLAALGAVAAEAGGAFVTGAHPRLVGATDLPRAPHQSDWSEPDPAALQRMALLRESAVAPFIGLAMPRVLGRVPYGKRSDPISRCDFAELGISPAHEHFLWINPAFALAQLIAAAFADEAWSFRLGTQLTLTDLPTAIYHDGYDQVLKPCAETALDYDSAERMHQHGFMALISHRGEASLQLQRFQSIAQPAAALAGPWK